MKKIAIIITAFAISFSGCKKDIETVSTVVNVTYPGIALNGPAYVHIPVNGTYTDQGAILTDDITGAQSPVSPLSSDLDPTTPGMYKVVYSAANSNGFKTEAIRTILVLDYTPPAGLDTTIDISGQYERTATGVVSTLARVEPGLYIMERVGGSTPVPAYMLMLDANTIDIPAQTSFDGFPLDVNSESFSMGPPTTFSYRVAAENFGTGLRTFVKL